MARVSLHTFYGITPRVPPRSMTDGLAQVADNCDLSVFAELKPLHGNRDVRALDPDAGGTPVKTLYLFKDSFWFTRYEDADIVRGPIPEDAWDRTYFTDGGAPKVTREDVALGIEPLPAYSYRLGVPAPASPPTLGSVGGTADAEAIPYDTSYVQTYVTHWGEEGPPGDPSDLITVSPGETVPVTLVEPPVDHNIKSTRLYRLNTGSAGAEFQFVDEIILPFPNEYIDDSRNEDLMEVIPSETWYPPPDENHPTGPLKGLIGLPNGALAGFTGETVCFSLPYLPHAWPYEARYTIKDNIVGLCLSQAGVIVMTDHSPYVAVGNSPAAMSLVRLPANQACASKRSIVDMGGYAIYASPEGLVVCDGANATVVTESFVEESEWRERFNPESIQGYRWEGQYVGFYDNGTEKRGFLFNPKGEKASFSMLDFYADAGYQDRKSDLLYLNVNDRLVIFSSPDEAPLTAKWRSRIITVPFAHSFAALRVLGGGTGTIKVIADGQTIGTYPMTLTPIGRELYRLPSGFRAKEWEVEVELTGSIEQIDLVTSVKELIDG